MFDPTCSNKYTLYQQVVEKERQELTHLAPENSTLHIFAILMKLKMICNHPSCYLKTPSDYQKTSRENSPSLKNS